VHVWDAESGELHRELESFGRIQGVTALATFLSADGQQVRLVAGASANDLRVYDPEAGSVLHNLHGHGNSIPALACIASSSAAPHHPRLVSASTDGIVKVWDGETGERLADLRRHEGEAVMSVAVWKEHVGGRDRIATASDDHTVKVYCGESFAMLRAFACGGPVQRLLSFKPAEGPHLLLVIAHEREGLQRGGPPDKGGHQLRPAVQGLASSRVGGGSAPPGHCGL
jgi:WD40 repeat protein